MNENKKHTNDPNDETFDGVAWIEACEVGEAREIKIDHGLEGVGETTGTRLRVDRRPAMPSEESLDSEHLAAVRNLLAVVHRDGGHHTERVGLVQSLADAERIVSRLHCVAEECRETHSDAAQGGE